MAVLTPWQVLLIAVIGGCVASLATAVLRLMWLGLHRLFEDYVTWREARRIRRHHLQTCRAIDALGTTTQRKD
ncbi:hypothetical protein ACIP4S_13245 [Streptomyces chartreusis]|uniref:hypothetical protein n=1 Tax=Streptomyces chartreusis TaxID=1969 RepID=UPI003821C412